MERELKMQTNNLNTQNDKPANPIFERLGRIRLKFLKKGVKKTGYNKFMGFHYFTLDDIVPAAQELFFEERVCIVFSTNADRSMYAALFDMDDPNLFLKFDTGIVLPKDAPKTNEEIQQFGKIITYSRRYLYTVILDICEVDVVDEYTGMGTTGKPYASHTPPASTGYTPVANSVDEITEEQKEYLRSLYKKCQESNLCPNTRAKITQNGKAPITRDMYEEWSGIMECAINQRKQNI
jgi:hypothetical protein